MRDFKTFYNLQNIGHILLRRNIKKYCFFNLKIFTFLHDDVTVIAHLLSYHLLVINVMVDG
jgi:hypothetical protein